MVVEATTRLSVSDFILILCSSHYQEKSALTHVYPLTLDGLVAFSENTLLSNAQCDTGPQLHGE